MRLDRIAAWSFRRRWVVLGAWVVALVAMSALGNAFAADPVDDFELPGTDSQQAYDTLAEAFPQQSGGAGQIVFRSEAGVDDPAVVAAAEAVFEEVAALADVTAVISPYDSPDGSISPDGRVAFASVTFAQPDSEVPLPSAERFVEITDEADSDLVDFEAGGIVAARAQQPEFGAAEGIGLLAAVIILLVAFGSLLAMGLPIVSALFGIGIGLAIVSLLGNLISVPSFAAQIAAMIGIGVGIDYALFIVTRHRTAMSEGKGPEAAALEAIGTAGRAVMFAGTVVVVALLGMLIMDFVVVRGLALSAASVVAMTMLASITLLPALLGFSGENINRFGLRWFHHDAGAAAARESIWFRWSRFVQRRPAPVAIVGFAVVIGLTLPLFSMRLGVSDSGNSPESVSHRRAYDMLAEGFGPGFNGPFLVVADTRGFGANAAPIADALQVRLVETDGVAFATPPRFNDAGDVAVVTVFADSAPQDPETDELLARIRGEVVPELRAVANGPPIYVGGITASFVDFGDKIGERLPLFIGVVIILSFLLLTAVFRSPLVSLKAAILNLLSISAAYGVIVAIFQWGWGAELLGVTRTGPIESWLPMMMFAILFGLSMDYEVFLLSRIREEYQRTGDNALAVADGLASTARVITAAAAIMISVFMSFVFGDERVLKLMGVGLASAIFIDATIVRMVLVPSTMELLGDRNWWLPPWLDRLLPNLDVERSHLRTDEEPSTSDA